MSHPLNAVVFEAMENHQCLAFHYHGRSRVLEPHFYGRSRRGCDVVTGFVLDDGLDPDRNAPMWREFNVEEMLGLRLSDEDFDTYIADPADIPPAITEVYYRV